MHTARARANDSYSLLAGQTPLACKLCIWAELGLVLSAKLELNPYSLFIVGLHVARYLHTHESVYPPTVAMGMSLSR